ncbi:MAG TPA: type II secretion system F family protein [Actinomycetes bacterium]
MGAFLGLVLGLGLVLVVAASTDDPARPRRQSAAERLHNRFRQRLVEAGFARLGIAGVVAWMLAGGVAAFVVTAGISRSVVISVAFAAMAAYSPLVVVGARRRRRQDTLRGAWPDVVDDLTSAVRAGLSLPEALIQLSSRGPVALRPAFAQFAVDYRAGGRFGESLDRLKDSLADPVGDRVVESLRMAREVGGNDLGRLLRTLSRFLREDARTRGELEARQSWTVNGARLAVAAPWVLLALLATRRQAVAAYDSAAGLLVIGSGAGACLVAYRLMMRIGRLPVEGRVLR